MITNARAAAQEYVPGTSRGTRTASTLRLHLLHALEQQELMDDQRKREIGARIRELRVDSPYTQQAVADRVGVTLRALQKWEQGRGITYENVERVANVFDVDVDYVLKGVAKPAPNLIGGMNPEPNRLNVIEQLLREILSRLDVLEQLREKLDHLDEDARKTWVELAAHDMEVMSRLDAVEKTMRDRPQEEPPR